MSDQEFMSTWDQKAREFMSDRFNVPAWMTCDHRSYHREGKRRAYRACGEKAFERAFDADGVTGFLCRYHAGLNQEDIHF